MRSRRSTNYFPPQCNAIALHLLSLQPLPIKRVGCAEFRRSRYNPATVTEISDVDLSHWPLPLHDPRQAAFLGGKGRGPLISKTPLHSTKVRCRVSYLTYEVQQGQYIIAMRIWQKSAGS